MYDTLIIGAGLSGLAAGIRLAYFGQKVCVLERHYTIGGLNSFYRLRHRDYDVGLHAVTNYAKPGTKTGPLSKLLRQLRLKWDDFDLRPQTQSRIIFPGAELKFTNDFALFEEEVARVFPAQRDAFRQLVAKIDSHDELNLGQQQVSARQVLGDIISDPLLVDMLFCPLMFYGSAVPGDMDFNQFVVMFKSIFEQGFGRPYAGVRLIMKNVIRKYRECGGELKLRAGVKEIVTDGRRTTGVILESGEHLEARNVVSSAGLAETLRMCDLQAAPERDADPRNAAGDISFMESIFMIDKQPADLGHHDTIIFYSDVPEFHYENPEEPCDLRSGIICSPNNFEYEQPLKEGCMRITALANHRYWLNLPDAEYQTEKQVWAGRMLEGALQHTPDFRPNILDTDVFTPRTIQRFTSHINGCVYGAPHKRMMGETHLENLFLCGTDQGYLGIVGSMLSGITIANLHLLKGESVRP
jgi:phytoene dehydrogenase-like protein